MKKVLLCLAAVLAFSTLPASAQHVVEKGITLLNTAELKRIYGKGKFVLVNTLSPVEFQEKRIAGSINVPLSHYAQERAALPGDLETRFIFYCMGQK